jgi:hypothetical protein
VHHALFDLAGFGELGFEGGDFGVHIGEDGGDGGLFFKFRNLYFNVGKCGSTNMNNSITLTSARFLPINLGSIQTGV